MGHSIGAVNVAVNWRLAPAEMAAIIDDSEAPLLVVHTDYLEALASMPGGLPAVRRIVVVGDADAAPSPDRALFRSTPGSRVARPRIRAISARPTR